MFSDSAREKFARVVKPAEFVKTKRPAKEEDEDNDSVPKKKKPKHLKRQMIAEAAKLGKSVEELASTVQPTDEQPEDNATIEAADDKYEERNRTVFVGNLPISATVKSVTKFFRTYGEVSSVRLRSVPIAGTAVDEKGNQELVRKVCVNQRKFGDQKGSFNAYVVFKDESSVSAALEANNTIIDKRHIRVDTATPTLSNPKKTVFLGSLSYYTDEEELRDHFAAVLPNGQDDIEAVRLVRDNETLIGKGFGYMSFKSAENVLQALSLHEVEIAFTVLMFLCEVVEVQEESHSSDYLREEDQTRRAQKNGSRRTEAKKEQRSQADDCQRYGCY